MTFFFIFYGKLCLHLVKFILKQIGSLRRSKFLWYFCFIWVTNVSFWVNMQEWVTVPDQLIFAFYRGYHWNIFNSIVFRKRLLWTNSSLLPHLSMSSCGHFRQNVLFHSGRRHLGFWPGKNEIQGILASLNALK